MAKDITGKFDAEGYEIQRKPKGDKDA